MENIVDDGGHKNILYCAYIQLVLVDHGEDLPVSISIFRDAMVAGPSEVKSWFVVRDFLYGTCDEHFFHWMPLHLLINFNSIGFPFLNVLFFDSVVQGIRENYCLTFIFVLIVFGKELAQLINVLYSRKFFCLILIWVLFTCYLQDFLKLLFAIILRDRLLFNLLPILRPIRSLFNLLAFDTFLFLLLFFYHR